MASRRAGSSRSSIFASRVASAVSQCRFRRTSIASFLSEIASTDRPPWVSRARRLRSCPASVRGPVLLPPCMRHRPLDIAGLRQGRPPRVRALAPQRGAARAAERRLSRCMGSIVIFWRGSLWWPGFASRRDVGLIFVITLKTIKIFKNNNRTFQLKFQPKTVTVSQRKCVVLSFETPPSAALRTSGLYWNARKPPLVLSTRHRLPGAPHTVRPEEPA